MGHCGPRSDDLRLHPPQRFDGDTRRRYSTPVPSSAVQVSLLPPASPTASNAITPEELIQFMGYTFGTMDAAAEYYHIYKVKRRVWAEFCP